MDPDLDFDFFFTAAAAALNSAYIDLEEEQQQLEQEAHTSQTVWAPRVFLERGRLENLRDQDVKRRFRLSRQVILHLYSLLEEKIAPKTKRSQAVPGMTRLLATLKGFLSNLVGLNLWNEQAYSFQGVYEGHRCHCGPCPTICAFSSYSPGVEEGERAFRMFWGPLTAPMWPFGPPNRRKGRFATGSDIIH
uniref:Uncharacterized protein n=1 Tax=Pyxicephalus adspersus TaxID=30357 RepID=A0A499QYI4_PYXAD|nr:hypothetical protein maker-10K01-snap-gene-0.22 [Pyxicephalus adspersus]